MITAKDTLQFQILCDTIAGIFPHVIGQEWLVFKLVGREIVPVVSLTFYFNACDKVCKYVVDLDFFQTFEKLLTDPEEVNILFDRALIGANSMFGEDAPEKEEVSAMVELISDEVSGPASRQLTSVMRDFTGETSGHHRRQSRRATALVRNDPLATQQPAVQVETQAAGGLHEAAGPPLAPDHFNQVIWKYFRAFSKGDGNGNGKGNGKGSVALNGDQRAFVDECVSPFCESGDNGGQLGP